jgi:hypothetical protein
VSCNVESGMRVYSEIFLKYEHFQMVQRSFAVTISLVSTAVSVQVQNGFNATESTISESSSGAKYPSAILELIVTLGIGRVKRNGKISIIFFL